MRVGVDGVGAAYARQGCMFERILCPVDFSEYSDAALRVAAALAGRVPVAITLLHVVPPRSTGFLAVEPIYVPPRVVETLYQEKLSSAEGDLEQRAARLRAQCPEGTTVEVDLATGDTLDVIVERAGNHDLVVMGTHGLTGAARFLLGSVSEKVSRAAPCPVLIVPIAEGEETLVPRFRRVMIGIDYGPSAEATARVGAALAEPGGVVELVHAWSPPSLFFGGIDSAEAAALHHATEEQRAGQAERLAATAAVLRLEGVSTETYVANATASEGLLERAGETEPDLIVVGSHSREGLAERVLGTVADRVLRHAGRPVLLVPPPAVD